MPNSLNPAIFSISDLQKFQHRKQAKKLEAIKELDDFINSLIDIKDYAIANNLEYCYFNYEFFLFKNTPILENPVNCWFFQKEIKATHEDLCNGFVKIDLATVGYNIQHHRSNLEKMLKDIDCLGSDCY